jgi:uncharacterized protein
MVCLWRAFWRRHPKFLALPLGANAQTGISEYKQGGRNLSHNAGGCCNDALQRECDRAMRTITLEEHFSTPEFQEAIAKVWRGDPMLDLLQASRGKLLDVGKDRIADMDAAGIDMQVLSLSGIGMDKLDPATATALARDTNDKLAVAVQAHPDRFAAFATLALQEPEKAAVELERCVRQLGFKGALVNGTTNGLFLDHPRFTPLFEAAQALDVPVYLHPGLPPEVVKEAYYGGLPRDLGFFLSIAAWGWHVETGMHSLRLITSGLFDRLPKLKIIIGHMGEALPYFIVRADAVLAQAAKHLERRISEYFHEHFYITTSGYFSLPPFLCALQVAGADRILFSVDYPFSPNALGRAFLNGLSVSPEDMAKIAHGNAERLLKL